MIYLQKTNNNIIIYRYDHTCTVIVLAILNVIEKKVTLNKIDRKYYNYIRYAFVIRIGSRYYSYTYKI